MGNITYLPPVTTTAALPLVSNALCEGQLVWSGDYQYYGAKITLEVSNSLISKDIHFVFSTSSNFANPINTYVTVSSSTVSTPLVNIYETNTNFYTKAIYNGSIIAECAG